MNSTNSLEDPAHQYFLTTIIFALLSILAIGGNSLCLLVLRKAQHLKTSTRLFLTSLTCADLLQGLLVIFPSFVVLIIYDFLSLKTLQNACTVKSIAYMLSNTLSTGSLLCVNLDRYIAIEYPLRCGTIMTTKRARISIACIWLPILFGSFIGCYTVGLLDITGEYNDRLCGFTYSADVSLIGLSIGMVLLAVFPFIITVMIYVRILVIVDRQKTFENTIIVGTTGSRVNARRTQFAERKALNMFLLVTVVSCATWVPFTAVVYYIYFSGELPSEFTTLFVQIIAFCNPWINILIYTWRDQSFRKCAIKTLFCCTPSTRSTLTCR